MTTAKDRRVVRLDPCMMQPIAVYAGVTDAASNVGVSRQAMHNALNQGSVCADTRWSWALTHDTWVELHGGLTVDQFLALK